MQHDEKLKQKLTTYIQDAYGMENQIVETLEHHVQQAEGFPQIQSRLQQHLEATKQHRARMEERLRAYGEQPSTVKGAMTAVMGKATGAVSALQSDTLAMNARADYVTEHLEIAAYSMLIATARAYGDQETVRASEANLRDELAMQQWLEQHLPMVALLSLRQDGIEIPDTTLQSAGQPLGFITTQRMGVTPRNQNGRPAEAGRPSCWFC